MTKEQILALSTLTKEQKERVEASFDAAIKFKKPCKFESLNTTDEVVKEIERLQKNYSKRKEAEAGKKAKEQAKQEQLNKVAEMMALAEKEKIELNIDDIEYTFNEKYNARIDEQIAILEGKKRPTKKKK